MDFEQALALPSWKLSVLFNESLRQRALDVTYMGLIFGGKEVQEELQNLMKVHGPYTEGFYERELNSLFEAVKNESI